MPQKHLRSWGCVVLLHLSHKPRQHSHRLFITRIHQISDCCLDVVDFFVLMELAIPTALHTRFADTLAVGAFRFHRQDRSFG